MTRQKKPKDSLDVAVDDYTDARKEYNNRLWWSRQYWQQVRREDAKRLDTVGIAQRADEMLKQAEARVLETRQELIRVAQQQKHGEQPHATSQGYFSTRSNYWSR